MLCKNIYNLYYIGLFNNLYFLHIVESMLSYIILTRQNLLYIITIK